MEKTEMPILVELKECYDNGLLSALVGAGFSKNVSNQFLGWGELLYDMIGELYKIDIKRHYDNYLHQNRDVLSDLKDENEVKKEYINEITQKEDYLDIVSKYIKKKGFRESLEIYIEGKVPYVSIDKENNIVLSIGDKVIENVSEQCFSAHKELLKAEKLQNIYTTNYENLIEFTKELLEKEEKICFPEVVKSGRDLSNKLRNRNIIKIHGDLRSKPDIPMRFDGDNKLCYIIAKEDYETYKEKHEAFTSLMRIAMLQGKFMLLGFSGTDANYKGWVSWISDVLDSDSKDTKIYIIDVSGEDIPLDLQWYYENHHTKVVNLIEKDNLSRLELSDEDISLLLSKSHEKKLENKDKRQILTAFLKYLSKTTKTIGEQSQQLGGTHDALSQESKQSQSDSEQSGSPSDTSTDMKLSMVRPNAYNYRKLWYEAYEVVSKSENTDIIANKIRQVKLIYRFPKVIYNQDSFIDSVISRKKKISNSDAYLLALAIEECGINPYYYSKVIQDYEELDKLPLWNMLKVKEETFNGINIMLPGNDDDAIYENIQRLLFHLDFKAANDIILQWKPIGYFVIAKSMRLASIKGQRESACSLLDNYIKETDNPLSQLYAIQIANYISDTYPRPYNSEEFYRFGIDGIGDNLDFMLQQLRGKIENPRARGWIGSTMNFGGSDPKYEKSLRILRYISDTGLYLNFGHTYFFDKASWYQVFKNLYEVFPYPCFFYSIQSSDNDLQTRIGQDFAYSQKLSEFNKDILVRSVKAYGEDSTPQTFLYGLLNVIGPMYIAVNESLWFNVFKMNIFKKLIDNFDKFDTSDILVKNIKFALVSLKEPRNIIYVLKELLYHYRSNPTLADSFIRDNLHIRYINEKIPNEIWTLLKDLIDNYPKTDITGLIFFMEENYVMNQVIKDAFIEKIINSKEEELPKGHSASFYLCLLTKENPLALKISKTLLLKHDVWHCGITEDGKGWSNPGYIRLNAFQNKIEWDDSEFNCICNNLRKNITKYAQMHNNLHGESFLRNAQVAYLSDILSFIDGLSDERKISLQDIRIEVESLLNKRISYNSLIEGMLSEQSVDAVFAMDNVVKGIKANGLSTYLNEFNFILDRAIIGDGLIINSVLQEISFIVKEFPEQIVTANLCPKLHTIISLYKERWSKYEEFKPVWSFNYLYTIANFLSRNGYKESEEVLYWLNDPFVQIFIRL